MIWNHWENKHICFYLLFISKQFTNILPPFQNTIYFDFFSYINFFYVSRHTIYLGEKVKRIDGGSDMVLVHSTYTELVSKYRIELKEKNNPNVPNLLLRGSQYALTSPNSWPMCFRPNLRVAQNLDLDWVDSVRPPYQARFTQAHMAQQVTAHPTRPSS